MSMPRFVHQVLDIARSESGNWTQSMHGCMDQFRDVLGVWVGEYNKC